MVSRLFCLALPPATQTARGIMTSGVDLSVPGCCAVPPRILALCGQPMQVFCAAENATGLAALLGDASQGFSVQSLTASAALRGRDFGQWAGCALSGLPEHALQAFAQDACFAPPEGESWQQFTTRLLHWLQTEVPDGTQALLMVAPSVMVGLVHGLLAPAATTPPDLDVAAGAWLALTRHGRWRVRLL